MFHRYNGKHAVVRVVQALSVRARIGIAIATLASLSVAGLALSGSASASATKCNSWGPQVSVKGIGLTFDHYCGTVQGGGDYVQFVTGSFMSYTGCVSNWNITAEFFADSNGGNHWVWTKNGSVHSGCYDNGSDSLLINSYPIAPYKNGFVCSTLKSNGTRLTSWCASIYP
jgi:hypothetical protein